MRKEGMRHVTQVVLRVKWRKRQNIQVEKMSEEPKGRKSADGVQWKVYPSED